MGEGHGGAGGGVAGRGRNGERIGESDVILFQLKTHFLKKRRNLSSFIYGEVREEPQTYA